MSREEPGEWPLTHEEVEEWARKQKWHFAKTMAHNPHSYCLKRETDPRMFELVVLHIREHGSQNVWWNKEYTQYEADDHVMWSMGDALETTILINRKSLEQVAKDEASGKGGSKKPRDPQSRLL